MSVVDGEADAFLGLVSWSVGQFIFTHFIMKTPRSDFKTIDPVTTHKIKSAPPLPRRLSGGGMFPVYASMSPRLHRLLRSPFVPLTKDASPDESEEERFQCLSTTPLSLSSIMPVQTRSSSFPFPVSLSGSNPLE